MLHCHVDSLGSRVHQVPPYDPPSRDPLRLRCESNAGGITSRRRGHGSSSPAADDFRTSNRRLKTDPFYPHPSPLCILCIFGRPSGSHRPSKKTNLSEFCEVGVPVSHLLHSFLPELKHLLATSILFTAHIRRGIDSKLDDLVLRNHRIQLPPQVVALRI